MLLMSKPKKRGRKPGKRKGSALNFWIDSAINEALERYIAGIEPATSKRAVVELSLRRYLESVGAWPPKS